MTADNGHPGHPEPSLVRHGSRLRVDRWDPATCGAREAGKGTRPRADHRESRGVTAVTAATANVTGARHGGHGGVRHHSGHSGYYYSGYYYGGHDSYRHGGHGGYEPDGGHYHVTHHGSHGDCHVYIGCYAVAPPTISSHHTSQSHYCVYCPSVYCEPSSSSSSSRDRPYRRRRALHPHD